MFRTLGVTGAVVGAALGAVLMAGTAQADVQVNENDQLVPVQLCNTNVAVLGIVNSEGESCYNGSQQGNLDK